MKNKTVIIIGGGLGGLSAAISLAQAGYDVSLYEKNNHIGGKLNRLDQDGFGFDLGPSILTMPQIFERLFTASGKSMKDYVPIEKLDHQWRSFFPNGNVIDLYEDLNEMQEKNPALSENDMREYQNLLHYSKKLYDMTDKIYFQHGVDTTRQIMKHTGLFAALKNFDLFSTVHGAINKRISNEELRVMLSYFIKYVGSSPYDAPAVLNMMIYMQHDQGLWYVPGGLHNLSSGLVKLAEEVGVTFHLGRQIVKLEKENGKINGAVLEDGTKLTADYFVSNMEVIPVYERLLEEDSHYVKKLKKKFEPASSGLVMHLGVKKSYPQLRHHNFFFADNMKQQMQSIFHRHELPDDPVIYLVNVNKTDPTQAPAGHENIKVLPHIPYIRDQHPLTQQDYEQFSERVLIKLEKMGLHDLRDNIVTKDVWTPEDIRRMYGSDRGAIYGTVSDRKKNKGFKHPKQSELYDNLYFVGGTVNPGGGMPMVTLSGQLVSEKIVQRDVSNG
ncbi:phytoene desaturase [Peribacillus muralis]|uniref:phytoene desaturase family protein n=1 Tax=Peribacillus muralis TaxID=264697 RepID=UPI001F4D455A|nr:phytoene desaturase family protein [Peribacillus muralis]MCK1994042.1 phytoene desaturase family protein [Peribacillus muralis]MCK2014597.1 phytoene desaturase family protein [Peribacillus muralis]